MRGYRYLKESNQLGCISAVKEVLTNTKINQCERGTSKYIFGAGHGDAEHIIRQYLLVHLGGLNLNRALLCAHGKAGSGVVHPLPPEWRIVVERHGFKVARIRSALAWNGFVIVLLAYGMASIVRQLVASVKEKIRPSFQVPGRFAYFDALAVGNLPQSGTREISHDIVTWYQQRFGKISRLGALCHGVKGVTHGAVESVPVISVPSAIPPLTNLGALVRFAGWSVVASALAIIDLLRGRWWHALILREASSAAIVRMHQADKLARDYLFHNSSWIYRPLWTYEAEKQASRIIFYFYSTNCESFKRPNRCPSLAYGWQAMNWPHYLVWDDYQADFVRRAVGESATITIVGPIWFHAGGIGTQELPQKAVAVFDVQPVRDAFYQTLGIELEYYTPIIANQFISDVYGVLSECGGSMALKRKRNIGRIAHPKYRQHVEKLDGRENFVSVDPDMSAVRLIEDCFAVISMPFTSTALIGRWLGKPSVYYDPSGLIEKGDRAAHGIEIICGAQQLHEWMASVINLGADE